MIYDILVVGNGGAGLTTAIELKRKGLDVVVLSKTNSTSSQTVQAQGGINAVLNHTSNDTVQNHIDDTYKSSHEIGNIDAISMVCSNANDTIEWLDNLGVAFSRNDNEHIAQRKMAGSSNARTCYSSDYTGLKIMHTLYDTALKLGIKFIEDHLLLSIIKEDETIKGITSLNLLNTKVVQILAKKTIIATGGYAGVYYNHNTNSSATTSDGIIAAYNVGCHIKNMEFIQFHPTALKDKYILISESARAEGGYLVLKDGTRFVDELLPRDIVAREIYMQIQEGHEVFLDLRHLGENKIKHLIPQEYNLCFTFKGLKMDQDLIPIIPAAHYSMGGIKINQEGQSNIENLYAVGECSSTGVHGANRLGGNSLLEIISYGRNIAKYINIENIVVQDKVYDTYTNDCKYIQKLFDIDSNNDFVDSRDKLGSSMYHNVGLFRDEKNLNNTLEYILKLKSDIFCLFDKSKVYNTNLKELIEFKNMLETSKLIIYCALFRKESRGAHTRVDFNLEQKDLAKSTIIYKNKDKFSVGYEDEN